MNAMGINQLIMDPARALKSLPESTACCVSPAAGPRPRMSRLVSSRLVSPLTPTLISTCLGWAQPRLGLPL